MSRCPSLTVSVSTESEVVVRLDADVAVAPAVLSAKAKQILKSFGGWTGFLQSYGLKPWNDEDAEEGKAILEALARDDRNDG